MSSAEGAVDGVAKSFSLVRALISLVLVLVNDCNSDVSPVNNSDSDFVENLRQTDKEY